MGVNGGLTAGTGIAAQTAKRTAEVFAAGGIE